MEHWTEIASEDVAVIHIRGYHVLVPIDDDVSMGHVREVKETIEWRKAHERCMEDFRAMARDLEEKQRARERLEDAGYDPTEIPL